MAAYASLVCLSNNMQQIQNHPRLSTTFDKKHMESLLQRIDFLLDFIQRCNSSYGGYREEAEELERKIASAAHAAEDVIESHIVEQILTQEEGSGFLDKKQMKRKVVTLLEKMQLRKSGLQRVMLHLQRIIKDMDSVQEKVMKVKEEWGFKDELPNPSIAAASSRPPTAGKSDMVGFDGYSTQLLDELTGHQPDLKIIPIVGMGGIGKTTLARNAFDSLLVVQHFDVRAWVTVSQRFDVRQVLFKILSCLRLSKNDMVEKSALELGEQLHKTLSGRRYLIVVDDMWSIEAWDRIKFFFPNNHNRSRIVVTTRISDVASHFGSIGLALNFLDDDQSWKLFCDKVFPHQVCPLELEESGKNIVKKCKGLPLAIVLIGGVLRNSSRTQHQWENVEKDIRSILNTADDNRCLKLLSLSYSHLPACLKPCFLYLGIFPEDDVIRLSRLVKLWVAEGFIKPNNDKSLEEIAEGYIEDLVDRNLISVRSLRCNGKFKACGIHDLVRELCISISGKEKFFCSTSVHGTPQEGQTRIVVHGNTGQEDYYPRVTHVLGSKSLACYPCIFGTSKSRPRYPRVFGTLKSKTLARSVISKGYLLHVKSRLLRVLVEVYGESIDDTLRQVNLRFLAHESRHVPIPRAATYHLPSSISLLWNVQTLIMTGEVECVVAPSQIWEMPQLRHLKFNCISLPDPPPTDGFVLHNLQTLGCVQNFRCLEDVCKRMPNIKKLHIVYDGFSREGDTWSYYCLHNFVIFDKLESLKYDFLIPPNRNDLFQSLMFPSSLKRLSLNNCELEWNELTVVGSLPHVEVLKLKFSGNGLSWNPVEGEFLRLRYLKIERCKLICWNADNTHFPVLENLVLDGIHDLNEIPSGIGDVHTLECIYLVNCSYSVALSAVKILEEQESLGNQRLQLKIQFWNKRGVERFLGLVEREGLTVINLQTGYYYNTDE